MALTNKLLKDFADVIAPKKEKTAKTVQATVTDATEGAVKVKIDGAEEDTLVSSTAEVEEGDRVNVSLENHKAQITGDITNKSAGWKAVEDGIAYETERATAAEGSLSSRISITASEVSSKMSRTDFNGNTIASEINQTAGGITLKAPQITFDGLLNWKDSSASEGSAQCGYADEYGGFYFGALLRADNLTIGPSQVATVDDLSDYALANHTHSQYSTITITHPDSSPTEHTLSTSAIGNFWSGASNSPTGHSLKVSSGSDSRIKKNISDLEDISEIYLNLKPKKFQFSEKLTYADDRVRYGFIAQDVEQAFTEQGKTLDDYGLVFKSKPTKEGESDLIPEGDLMYNLDMKDLHAMHVQMIQSLQSQINDLKAEIKELKEAK